MTRDPWVLDSIVGYRLELESQPRQRFPPRLDIVSEEMSEQVDMEVAKMLQKEAVRQVTPVQSQFLSRLFTVPKKDGTARPVVNLRPLNQYMQKQRFKMESIAMLRHLLKRGDWMGSIDLKDAFQSVPIHKDFRKLLRFMWKERLFEFRCLPFGLSSAPRTFSKILKPVMALFRRSGIRCLIFIDDLLMIASSPQELRQILQEAVTVLTSLGFRVNREKLDLVPSQEIQYLGFIVNSKSMTLCLPKEKIKRIVQDSKHALARRTLSVRAIARLIGRMSAVTQAVLPAPLYYRALQRVKNTAFKASQSFDVQVELSAEAQEELKWWIGCLSSWNGRALIMGPPEMTVESDASLLGWGALSGSSATRILKRGSCTSTFWKHWQAPLQ